MHSRIETHRTNAPKGEEKKQKSERQLVMQRSNQKRCTTWHTRIYTTMHAKKGERRKRRGQKFQKKTNLLGQLLDLLAVRLDSLACVFNNRSKTEDDLVYLAVLLQVLLQLLDVGRSHLK